jgi:hypothetical protein
MLKFILQLHLCMLGSFVYTLRIIHQNLCEVQVNMNTKCMYTAQGDLQCETSTQTVEHFNYVFGVRGSYGATCKNCKINYTSKQLICDCLKMDNKTYNKNTATSKNCAGQIVNDDGWLKCKF